ncbi:hypothetical protein XENOCAPTIV_009451, partial [Xenoophorus captivus]
DQNIRAAPGDTVILPCKAADYESVKAVEWSREDLKEENVLLYRNNKIDPVNQHRSYNERVDLQMKDGNVSLILKNVTPDDNGTYECRLERESFDVQPICIISLVVLPAGQQTNLPSSVLIPALTCVYAFLLSGNPQRIHDVFGPSAPAGHAEPKCKSLNRICDFFTMKDVLKDYNKIVKEEMSKYFSGLMASDPQSRTSQVALDMILFSQVKLPEMLPLIM